MMKTEIIKKLLGSYGYIEISELLFHVYCFEHSLISCLDQVWLYERLCYFLERYDDNSIYFSRARMMVVLLTEEQDVRITENDSII